jgi:hypothetical protein
VYSELSADMLTAWAIWRGLSLTPTLPSEGHIPPSAAQLRSDGPASWMIPPARDQSSHVELSSPATDHTPDPRSTCSPRMRLNRGPSPRRTRNYAHWVSVMVRSTRPGIVAQPVQPAGQNWARHLVTVPRLTPNRAATAMLGPRSAQASTIRARSASPCAVFRRFAQILGQAELSDCPADRDRRRHNIRGTDHVHCCHLCIQDARPLRHLADPASGNASLPESPSVTVVAHVRAACQAACCAHGSDRNAHGPVVGGTMSSARTRATTSFGACP